MRSSRPMEGNPWPHDMVLTIDDDSQQLAELLWVREAWALDPPGENLPPLLVDTPDVIGEPEDRAAWERAWPEIWDAAVAHAAGVNQSALFARLQDTADGSPERAALLHEMFGPSWRDRFGDAAFDDYYRDWSHRQFEARTRNPPTSLDEQPERRALDALIPAWQAGLVKVITIPCVGEHTRIAGYTALLVTAETRCDRESYATALEYFTQR